MHGRSPDVGRLGSQIRALPTVPPLPELGLLCDGWHDAVPPHHPEHQ